MCSHFQEKCFAQLQSRLIIFKNNVYNTFAFVIVYCKCRLPDDRRKPINCMGYKLWGHVDCVKCPKTALQKDVYTLVVKLVYKYLLVLIINYFFIIIYNYQ